MIVYCQYLYQTNYKSNKFNEINNNKKKRSPTEQFMTNNKKKFANSWHPYGSFIKEIIFLKFSIEMTIDGDIKV
ncbi:hypothetical protein DERP_008664 [Dermatophagoides pteronyssinus]|uniref:Uncharacterized protein n=1 Tax=Dermatophagoides pteronyssinus TaxID=6956 RepID=A0ABQ8IWZ3_DERPT|nr:hypothetical protein DERP_008664 [Dermatophagoides pteronyssinus]